MRRLFDTSCVVKSFKGKGAEGVSVLIFGWSGGRIDHVAKHLTCWEQNCREMIVMATPLSVLKKLPETEATSRVRDQMIAKIGTEGDVYLHIFSNGGLMFGSRAIALLGDRVKGVCFDSSPSLENSPKVPATVVREAMSGPTWLKHAVFYTLYAIFSILLFGSRLMGRKFDGRRYVGAHLISTLPTTAKKLFLFSSADVITNATLLKEFVVEQRGQGFDFLDSKHVQHFRKYPEMYAKQIKDAFFKKHD